MAQAVNQVILLNEVASTTTGAAVDVSKYQYVSVAIASIGGTATVKFRGAVKKDSACTGTISATNMWDYVGYIDCQTVTATAGDTGVSLTNGDCRNLVIYTAGLDAIMGEVTAVAGAKVTAYVVFTDNR